MKKTPLKEKTKLEVEEKAKPAVEEKLDEPIMDLSLASLNEMARKSASDRKEAEKKD